MISSVLMGAGLAGGSMLLAAGLLALVYRMHARRFHRLVAGDVLERWQLRLEQMPGAERERARLEPPAEVLAAMVLLPSGARSAVGELLGPGRRPPDRAG